MKSFALVYFRDDRPQSVNLSWDRVGDKMREMARLKQLVSPETGGEKMQEMANLKQLVFPETE